MVVSFLVLQPSYLGRNHLLLYFILVLLSYVCQCLFLAVSWVGLWYVIVSFPGYTRLLVSVIFNFI